MEFLKSISGFIGRLTGSLAGIAAIFYACGYLVARSHLNMLGLFGLMDFPREHYLQEGGKFFAVLAGMVISEMLPLFVLVFYLFIVLLVLGMALWGLCLFLKWRHTAERCQRVLSVWKGFFQTKQWLASSAGLLLLGYALIFHLLPYYNDFSAALGVSNLIYKSLDTVTRNVGSGRIERWLLEGNLTQLQDYFLHLLRGEFLAVVCLALAWYALAPLQSLRPWAMVPFLLVAVLYTLFTLMSYGVLMRPVKYPLVILSWKGHVPALHATAFSLLNKTDAELVLWNEVSKKVYCVPTDALNSMEVVGMRSLFYKADENPKEE